MAYKPEVGFGTLYKNNSDNSKAPVYRGYIRTADGIVGVAMWKNETRDGTVYLSIQEDSREGEYHAGKFDLPEVSFGKSDDRVEKRRARRDDDDDDRGARRSRSRDRDDDKRGRTRSRDDDSSRRSGRGEERGRQSSFLDDDKDDRREDRERKGSRYSDDDFDDEIPF